MRTPYMLLNSKANRSSYDRVFVYIVMFNVEDSYPAAPFYVDVTDNLSSRFNRHTHLTWHYEHVGRPAKIWIAGSVPKKLAEESVEDLTDMLTRHGFIMFKNRYSKLQKYSINDIKDYLSGLPAKSNQLQKWQRKWYAKVEKPTIPVAKENQEELQVLLQNILKNQTFPDITTCNLALNIAAEYDNTTGTSRVLFKNVNTEHDINKLKTNLNKIRHIWVPTNKMDPYAFNVYRLTKKFKKQMDESAVITNH